MQSCSDYFLLLFLCLAATSADRFYRIDRSQVNPYLLFVSIDFFFKSCIKCSLKWIICHSSCALKNVTHDVSWEVEKKILGCLLVDLIHIVLLKSCICWPSAILFTTSLVQIRIFCNCFSYQVLLGASAWHQCIWFYLFTDIFRHQKSLSCVCVYVRTMK